MDVVLYFVVYVCISGLVGAAVASAKRASRYQGFLWGFVLGPIGWIIAALVLKDVSKDDDEQQEKLERARDLAQKQREKVARPAGGNVVDDLAKLAALKQSGLLTDEEFAQQKQRLLAR